MKKFEVGRQYRKRLNRSMIVKCVYSGERVAVCISAKGGEYTLDHGDFRHWELHEPIPVGTTLMKVADLTDDEYEMEEQYIKVINQEDGLMFEMDQLDRCIVPQITLGKEKLTELKGIIEERLRFM